jgi:hypothetical protein
MGMLLVLLPKPFWVGSSAEAFRLRSFPAAKWTETGMQPSQWLRADLF